MMDEMKRMLVTRLDEISLGTSGRQPRGPSVSVPLSLPFSLVQFNMGWYSLVWYGTALRLSAPFFATLPVHLSLVQFNICMLWCGVIWYGACVCYGMVPPSQCPFFTTLSLSLVLFSVIWDGTLWYGMVHAISYGMVLY